MSMVLLLLLMPKKSNMPTIELDNCTKCLKCVKDCPSDAIDIEQGTINNACIHCGHCVAICPESTVFPDTDVIKKLHSSLFLLLISNIYLQISEHAEVT